MEPFDLVAVTGRSPYQYSNIFNMSRREDSHRRPVTIFLNDMKKNIAMERDCPDLLAIVEWLVLQYIQQGLQYYTF